MAKLQLPQRFGTLGDPLLFEALTRIVDFINGQQAQGKMPLSIGDANVIGPVSVLNPTTDVVKVTVGAGGATLVGAKNGSSGKQLIIINLTPAIALTIASESASADTGDRFYNGGGGDLANVFTASYVYDGGSMRWLLVSWS